MNMYTHKFDPAHLDKLNNPERLKDIPPEYIWNKLELENPHVLIDIGAGTGFYAIHILPFLTNGKIYACDISSTMIRWVKEHVCQTFPKIIPVLMEESSVPLDSGIADMVYMFNVHHECEKPVALLRDAHRLLKTNGSICILDWKKEEMESGPPTHIRCTPQDVENQLIEAGFCHISIYTDLATHFLITAQKQ